MLQSLPSEVSRGQYTVRFIASAAELHQAQALRYQVFYEELSAHDEGAAGETRLDTDRFDAFCDHLIVVHEGESGCQIVGTYRLLRQDVATQHGGFYSESEFDVAPLLARKSELRFLELGRSCVLKAHRTKAVIDLLWQGIWNFVRANNFDVMFGCASLEGSDAAQHASTLTYLAQNHSPPEDWHVAALPARRVPYVPVEGVDPKDMLRALPPLVKGYLRLGCYIGDGAVEDKQFDTTDVLIILPVSRLSPRYLERFK